MTIREGRLEDAARISALLEDSARRFFDFPPEGLARFLEESSPAAVAGRMSGDYRFLVAETGPTLVGVCAVRAGSHLYYLFTHADFQRRGIAKALWSAALKGILEGSRCSAVTVNATNFAVPAYERLGFVRASPTQTLHGIIFNPMVLELRDRRQG